MKSVVISVIMFTALAFTNSAADLQGLPAEISVNVIGCQQHPIDSAHVLLLGSAEAEDLGGGDYRFAEVYPGEYELFVYTTYSDLYREKLVVGESFSRTHLNVMLCMCIECASEVEVTVVDSAGKKVKNALVSIPALFIESVTDKKGRATFEVPAGEWEFAATANGNSGATIGVVPFFDPGVEPEPTKLTITIE
ncbi:MAG: carboxypeptidase regulatory-like domain-containing protein [Candidatus Coatesbacteria bacterium]|nr:MAG: carboxypeptidase regulatory-like domain-containing protein [Candidatus Coatesbacteria bacterium]